MHLMTSASDIRTTMNIHGDVVTNEMAEAQAKVVSMAIPAVNCKRIAANAKWLKAWRREWDSKLGPFEGTDDD